MLNDKAMQSAKQKMIYLNIFELHDSEWALGLGYATVFRFLI